MNTCFLYVNPESVSNYRNDEFVFSLPENSTNCYDLFQLIFWPWVVLIDWEKISQGFVFLLFYYRETGLDSFTNNITIRFFSGFFSLLYIREEGFSVFSSISRSVLHGAVVLERIQASSLITNRDVDTFQENYLV